MTHGFIPVPNVASIEFIWTANNVVCENVVNVEKGSPYSLADLQALRGVCDTWHSTSFKAVQCTSIALVRIRTKARDTATSPTEDYVLSPQRQGTVAQAMSPLNVTASIKLATGSAGRSYRGRWYFVGVYATMLQGNTNLLAATPMTSIVTSLNLLRTNLATAGHTLGVVSYYSGGWRSTGLFTAATGFVNVDFNVDSMRRRLTGRGL